MIQKRRMPPQPVKTTVVQVKPRNPFDVLADSDSEDSTPQSPVVSPVAPVAVAVPIVGAPGTVGGCVIVIPPPDIVNPLNIAIYIP